MSPPKSSSTASLQSHHLFQGHIRNPKILSLADIKFSESYMRTTLPDFCWKDVREVVRFDEVQEFDESGEGDTVVESVEVDVCDDKQAETREVWGDGKREWNGSLGLGMGKKRVLDDDGDDKESEGYTRQRETKCRKTITSS
jgi:hypothetical protein